jgi:hypothetical protein
VHEINDRDRRESIKQKVKAWTHNKRNNRRCKDEELNMGGESIEDEGRCRKKE